MEFKRKQRIKGKKAKHYKEWYAEGKYYRISWRNQRFGVDLIPAYHACVRCLHGDLEYWSFVGRRGTYQTLNAAEKACKQNQSIWNKFLAIEGRGKVAQFEKLKAEAYERIGSNTTIQNIPIWVLAQASTRLLEILCGKDLSDHTETSPSTSKSAKVCMPCPASSIPADNAEEPENSHTEQNGMEDNASESNAPSAKAPAKARKKSAKKRTAKSSPGGKKKRASTTPSKPRKKKRSKSSRKKKSKRSKS